MGSVREETTKPESLEIGVGRELLDFAKHYKAHAFFYANELYAGSELKSRSKRVLSLVCKRIEGVENPFQVTTRFNDPRYLDKPAHDAFEKARQAILDAIKEE